MAYFRQLIGGAGTFGEDTFGRRVPAIPFHHYMKDCLYHPSFGYYRSGRVKVGRDGDFYTSAYIGSIMGEQLAVAIGRLTNRLFPGESRFEVIDWGGGAGKLSAHMLQAWGESERFAVTVVESNCEHRRLAEAELEPYISVGRARVAASLEEANAWDPDLGSRPVVIVANELLDAFPVHRVVRRAGGLREWGVCWDAERAGLTPCLMEFVDPRLNEWAEREGRGLHPGQTAEAGLDAADWLRSVGELFGRAILLCVDYGDETEELISGHRMDGTVLCYYRHEAHNDPYKLPGEQDITAHVDFGHMRRAAAAGGWEEIGYVTQKRFLIESGVLDKLSAHAIVDPFHPVVRRNRAIRQLLLSDGMSELFKVQTFAKGCGENQGCDHQRPSMV